jgi:preprotein translocase subunit SecB
MAEQLPNGAADRQGDGEPQAVAFTIERIYVKDLSLENPGAPQSFNMTEPPQVEIGLRSKGDQIGTDQYGFELTLTITATASGKTVFLVEVTQAGVFHIHGIPKDQLQQVLAIHCPNVLFPYAREVVADATMRLGFPPVHLAPINFEALYQQQLLVQAQQPVPAVTN